MDSSLIKPYVDALGDQKARLEGYLTRGFQAIAIPTARNEMKQDRKDFLTTSGIWFLVIGIIGLVGGIAISQTGVIVAGCAAIMSGVYVYLKGKQAMRRDAFTGLGQSVYDQISAVAANVSSEWRSFMTTQNDSLKKAIVTSDADAATKVSLIDKVDSTPAVSIDLSGVRKDLAGIDSTERLDGYSAYLPKAADVIRRAIDAAGGAQQGIYSTLVSATAKPDTAK